MKNTPVRIGIVGCGPVAREHHLPALMRLPGAKVTALADTNNQRLERLGDRFGIRLRYGSHTELIHSREVDVVAVLTPTESHAEIGVAAVAAGKHLFIEKPLALTLAQCDRLITRSRKSDVKVIVGFNLRWHRLVRRARRFVASGSLGRIKSIRSVYTHFRNGETAPTWHRKRRLGGGVSFNEGVHHYDLWRYLLDTRVERIFSFSVPSEHYEDETQVTSASLANGTLATGVFIFTTGPNSEVEIYGERGRLCLSCYRFDGLEFYPSEKYPGDIGDRLKKMLRSLQELPAAVPAMRQGGDFENTFPAMWQHFIDCIRNDSPTECTLDDGRHAVQTALGAMESNERGRFVSLANCQYDIETGSGSR